MAFGRALRRRHRSGRGGEGRVGGVALGAVLIAQAAQLRPVAVSAVPIWLLAGFLSTTMFGAYVSGLTVVSGVLVIHVVILATVGYLFVRAFGYEEAIRCWLSAMAIVAILAAVTGLPSLASGRLRGGVPAVHPNELAALCVFPVLGLIWGFVNQRTRTFHHVLLAVLVLITWATGSRTALGAAVLGAVVILCSVRRPTPSRLVALIVATAGFLFIALGTDLLTRIFLRGGRENVTAVASRSIAWSAALTYTDDPWRQWAGSGIAMKEIAVRGQYWTTQLLDSSWVSAYVQTGRIGVLLIVVWIGWIIWSIRLVPRPNAHARRRHVGGALVAEHHGERARRQHHHLRHLLALVPRLCDCVGAPVGACEREASTWERPS